MFNAEALTPLHWLVRCCEFLYVFLSRPHCRPAEDGSVYTWGRGDSGQLGVGLRWREGPLPPPTLGTPTPTKVIDWPAPCMVSFPFNDHGVHTG